MGCSVGFLIHILQTRLYRLLIHLFSTFAVLIFVHLGILKRLRERSKYWRDRRAVECTESDKHENRNNIINTKKESKAAKALLIVLLAFSASLTPACIMIYLLNFCAHCNCLMVHWLRDLGIIIVLCNSGINPYLYAWRLPQFKRAFYKFLHLNSRGKIDDIITATHELGKLENQNPENRDGHEPEKISSL